MPFFDGLIAGLFLQLALGPVFFYIHGIALDSTFGDVLFAVSAVTLVDYLYIILSIVIVEDEEIVALLSLYLLVMRSPARLFRASIRTFCEPFFICSLHML